MPGPTDTHRSPRRTHRGLVIEGEIVARSRPAPTAPKGDAALAGLDLSRRGDGRAYQSLLDDAIRLARRCGPSGYASRLAAEIG